MEWVVVVLTSFAFCCLMELHIVTFNRTKPVMQFLPGGCKPYVICSEYVRMYLTYVHTYVYCFRIKLFKFQNVCTLWYNHGGW